MYQEETLLIVSGLSGIGAALLVHWLSAVLGRSFGSSDLVDRLGRAVSRDGNSSPALGLTVLFLGGAALGLLYGSLVYALGFSMPREVFGFSALLGILQALILVAIISQANVDHHVRHTAKSGFLNPVAAELCIHCCFGLCIGGVLSLFLA